MTLIIDCHGHYTTAPAPHNDWREAQKAAFAKGEAPPPYPDIPDELIRESVEANQLRLVRERGRQEQGHVVEEGQHSSARARQASGLGGVLQRGLQAL